MKCVPHIGTYSAPLSQGGGRALTEQEFGGGGNIVEAMCFQTSLLSLSSDSALLLQEKGLGFFQSVIDLIHFTMFCVPGEVSL